MARRDIALPSVGLVFIRFTAGVLLLGAGRGWFGGAAPDGPAIAALVTASNPELPAPLAWWGRVVLLENPAALAFVWPWLLTVTGAALALGFLTRPMGVLAAVGLLHALLYGRPEMALLHAALAAMALGCALSQAGRRAGIDGALGDSLPAGLTWSRKAR